MMTDTNFTKMKCHMQNESPLHVIATSVIRSPNSLTRGQLLISKVSLLF